MNVWSSLWKGIVGGLNYLLQAFYELTGNYGVAIILLTLLVKAVLLPLTIKQNRSMIAMQKIQPEIKKLQEKYKDDRERLSQEMMKFYKENKVNPLGGCLPLLLQLPVFFALFTVLRTYLLTPPTLIVGNTYAVFKGLPQFSTGLFGAYASLPVTKTAGFLWIKNLANPTSSADPTFILIALLAVSTWYSQKQVMTDPRHKYMMAIVPLITVFIGLSLPAGVILYWLTTNVLQIAQQLAMEYYDKKHPREEPKKAEARRQETEKTKQKTPVGKKQAAKEGQDARSAETARSSGKKVTGQAAQERKKSVATRKPTQAKGDTKPRKPKSPPPQQKKNSGGRGKDGTRKR